MSIPNQESKKFAEQEKMEIAREQIAKFLSKQEFPKVTVPREALDDILKYGLMPRPSAYLKDLKVIAATIGREPFLPPGEDRAVLEIHTAPSSIEPRFTGPKKDFAGVVVIKGGAKPEEIRVLEMKKGGEDKLSSAA